MLSRGGPERAGKKREALRNLLKNDPYPSLEALEGLDREYIRENLSPGGSADLLALCWLLYFLKKEDA
jgi:holo-ACP synthase/triphosphoribosyl-dephospho-CoA synthase